MQPFGFKNLMVLIIGGISLAAGWYFPVLKNLYIDILVRSALTSVLYFGLIYIFKVSDDINGKINKILKLLPVKL
jgi:hypothetical protein